MPRYKVIAPGFHNGILHKPEHPRYNSVTVEKAFAKGKIPSWLKPMKAESAAETKKREADQATVDKKVAADQKDIETASFLGEGEKSETVETL